MAAAPNSRGFGNNILETQQAQGREEAALYAASSLQLYKTLHQGRRPHWLGYRGADFMKLKSI
ncbi:MAG: hypothetical protein V7K48_21900 [Nostoc sp.]|uniref:hypothetical protein n=1 Tax=Nostoc sp. TaxID=1180 RepID=UPI002FF61AB5